MKCKKVSKVTRRKIVFVEWVDSTGGGDWVHEGQHSPLCKIYTVGFMIAKDRDSVTVSASVTGSDDPNAQSNAPLTIPRCAISKLKTLS